MRNGGAKAKGNAFERAVAAKLSLWLTNGQKRDILYRNIGSGSRFTTTEQGLPGDLMPFHPDAYTFCSKVSVECKHYADIGLERFLFHNDNSFLGRVFRKAAQQCANDGLHPVVIAKSNRVTPIFLCDRELGEFLINAATNSRKFQYHTLHREAYLMTTLDNVVNYTDSSRFLVSLRPL